MSSSDKILTLPILDSPKKGGALDGSFDPLQCLEADLKAEFSSISENGKIYLLKEKRNLEGRADKQSLSQTRIGSLRGR